MKQDYATWGHNEVRRFTVFFMVNAVLGAIIVGCDSSLPGGGNPPMTDRQPATSAPTPSGSTSNHPPTVSSAIDGDTKSYSPDAPIPQGFPPDIPIYAGAILKDTQPRTDKPRMFTFETSSSPRKAADFYKRVLKNDGWQVEKLASHVTQMVTMTSLLCSKDGRRFGVGVTKLIGHPTTIAIKMMIDEPPQSTHGATRSGIPFYFAKWKAGLTFMMIHPESLRNSSRGTGSSSSSTHASGSFYDRGKKSEWRVTSEDGRTGDFEFDGEKYQLADGRCVVVRNNGDRISLKQLDIDLSQLSTERAECARFVSLNPEIADALSASDPAPQSSEERGRQAGLEPLQAIDKQPLSLDQGTPMVERTWTSADGSKKLKGRLLGADDVTRKLRLEISGRPPKVFRWHRFHRDDIAYLQEYCDDLRRELNGEADAFR